MNIREINKPLTAKALNESLAKKFGQRIALEKFTLEQLQDVRNKVRTTLSQVETNESFNTVQSPAYQKNKLFLDVLNAEISERADIAEKEQVDRNGDGKNDWEDVKLARKAAAAKASGEEDKDEEKKTVKEGAEDQAELVMAAKNMVERVTSWMEDTAEMQTESMLELADAIRDEKGQEASDSYVNTVKPALESLYGAMETTRQALTQGVGLLTGEATPTDDMGAEPMDAGMDTGMEPTVDQDAAAGGEEPFAAADAAAGGEEEAGRAKRESRQFAKKKIAEQSRKLGTILSKKK